MPDVILAKPASGVTQQIPCESDSRFLIEFRTEDSTVSTQGDDLIFSFDDQSHLSLTNYLKIYSSETAPDLMLIKEGVEIDGRDFWQAIFQDDLQPGENVQQTAFSDLPIDSELAMGTLPDMVQPDDPSVISYMVTMQTTGA